MNGPYYVYSIEDWRALQEAKKAEEDALDEWQEGHDFQWREEE